jgi:hypothetical protein
MDDQAALIARRVALAVAAWFNAPAASRPIADSPPRWGSGRLQRTAVEDGDVDELLDDLADVAPPMPLGEGVAELEAALRRQARREL